jgi:hypothetical protein
MARQPLTPGLLTWAKSEKRRCPTCKRLVGFVGGAFAPHPRDQGMCPVNEILGLERKPAPRRRPVRAAAPVAKPVPDRVAIMRALGARKRPTG